MSHNATNLSSSYGKNNEGKPKLFSMNINNNRLLESKRHSNYLEQSSHKTPQRSLKTPSLLLTSLLANPPRSMTPKRPRMSDMPYLSNDPNDAGGNGLSPEFIASAERAYIQPRLSRLSARTPQFGFSPEASQVEQESASISVSRFDERSPVSTYEKQALPYGPPVDAIRNQELREENERIQLLYTQASRNLDECRLKLDDVITLSEANASELKQIRPALALARENLASKEAELSSTSASFLETKSALSDIRQKYELLTETLNRETTEKQKLEIGTGTLKAGVAKLSALYSELGDSFKELKKAHDISKSQLQELVGDAAETKKLAKNGLAALAPMLDDQNTLARAAETKDALRELSHDLSSSHQVTDILRDKLYHMSSQLCDAQERIKELEEEKRGALKNILSMRQEECNRLESFSLLERKINELSDKLSTREREAIDSLANAAVVEAKLEFATSQLQSYKAAQERQCEEIQVLRSEKDENMSNFLILQNTINARDKELISIKADLKALTESKAELRALLAESKKDLSQKMQELESRDPNIDLFQRISDLEAENATLQCNLHNFKDKHVNMLKLHQELEMELRNKLHQVDKTNSELLLDNTHLQDSLKGVQRDLKSSVPIETMNDKCQFLNNELTKLKYDAKDVSDRLLEDSHELKERLNVQSAHLFQSKEECAVLKERVNSLLDKLSSTQSSLNKTENAAALVAKLQENRALTAETTASTLQVRLDSTIEELKSVKAKLEEAEMQLMAANEASIVAGDSNIYESSERARADYAMIADLERKNTELVEAADGILARYNAGLLTDIEKRFVGCLMDEADRIHAEGVVKKENELRRRQVMVDDLKTKNAELQGTLARLLKEKEAQPGAVNKSIVGLRNWVSSSPVHNEDVDPPVGPYTHKEPSTASSIQHIPAPTSILGEPARPSGPGKHKGPNPPRFHDNVDSEDDIPLSEHSLLSADAEEGRKNTGNKRNRPESPPAVEEPNQSKRRTRISIIPPKPPHIQSPVVSPVTKKKTLESITKPKQKKRKQ